MKKTSLIAFFALALVSVMLLAGCLSLKPFTQDELDRLSGYNNSAVIQY